MDINRETRRLTFQVLQIQIILKSESSYPKILES